MEWPRSCGIARDPAPKDDVKQLAYPFRPGSDWGGRSSAAERGALLQGLGGSVVRPSAQAVAGAGAGARPLFPLSISSPWSPERLTLTFF